MDSSVIIAGLASSSGGSYEVLALAELGIIIPYISEQVVNEVLRNTQNKLPRCVEAFYTLVKRLPFRISDPADAPIMAAAMTSKVDWLLSLDSHFLREDWEGKVAFSTGTPGDFLQKLDSLISDT